MRMLQNNSAAFDAISKKSGRRLRLLLVPGCRHSGLVGAASQHLFDRSGPRAHPAISSSVPTQSRLQPSSTVGRRGVRQQQRRILQGADCGNRHRRTHDSEDTEDAATAIDRALYSSASNEHDARLTEHRQPPCGPLVVIRRGDAHQEGGGVIPPAASGDVKDGFVGDIPRFEMHATASTSGSSPSPRDTRSKGSGAGGPVGRVQRRPGPRHLSSGREGEGRASQQHQGGRSGCARHMAAAERQDAGVHPVGGPGPGGPGTAAAGPPSAPSSDERRDGHTSGRGGRRSFAAGAADSSGNGAGPRGGGGRNRAAGLSGGAVDRGGGAVDRGGGAGRGGGAAGAASFRSMEEARRINRAIIEAGRARRHEDILQVVGERGADFDAVNVATSLHRLGSCGLSPGGREAARLLADPRFGRLQRMAGQHLSSFAAREVANCLWALAKLGYTHQQHQQPGRAGADDDVATEALGPKCGGGGGGSGPDSGGGSSAGLLLGSLCARAEAVIQGFGPQELSNTLWALARLGYRHGALQTAMFTQAQKRITEFNPREISNFVLAAATLGLGPKRGGGGESSSSCGGGVRDVTRGHDQQQQQQVQGLMPAALLRQCCDRAAVTLQDDAPQGLSNLLWAVAKMGYRHEPLLSAAAKLASEDLAGILDGYATTGSGGSGVGGGRDGSPPGGRAAAPLGPARAPSRLWASQAVSNATWAYATLGVQPGADFLGLVCRHVSSPRHLPAYNWQDLANLMWALATLQHYDPAVMAAVEQQLIARAVAVVAAGTCTGADGRQRLSRELRTMRLQHVSNLFWAYASLRHPAPALFAALTPLLERRLPDVEDRDICLSVWSAAKLGHYDGRLLDVLAAHLCAHSRLQHLSPQMVANLAWSYGELRHAHRALFDGLVARTLAFTSASTAAAAAQAAGAPASSHGGDVVGTAAEAITIQDLSGVCGAVGVLGWRYPELVDAVEGWLLTSSYCSEGISTNTSSRQQAQGQWGDGSSSEEGATTTAAAVTGAAVTGAVPAAAAAAGGRRVALVREEQSICSLAWGLSLVGGCGPRVWGQLVGALGRLLEGREGGDGGVETLLDEEVAQLYQTYLHLQLDYPAAPGLASGPRGLLSRGARVWRQQCRQGARVSALQRQVSEALTRIGVKHTLEVLTDDGDFSVDLAVDVQLPPADVGAPGRLEEVTSSESLYRRSPRGPKQKQSRCDGTTADATRSGAAVVPAAPTTTRPALRPGVLLIAVEVDGPWHFTANTLQPLATTTYRRRCLEARGWTVVSVPYWSWYQAGGSHAEQDTLLTELLWGAGLADVLAAAVRAW